MPSGRDQPAGHREADADIELPQDAPDPLRHSELERGDRAAGTHDTRELTERRGRIGNVAEQVSERERVEATVLEPKLLGVSLLELDPVGKAGAHRARPADREHLGALVDTDDRAARPADELDRDSGSSCRDVEDGVARLRGEAGDEKPAPARILPERQEGGIAVVGRAERREQLAGLPSVGGQSLGQEATKLARMGLSEDLQRAAALARAFAEDTEQLTGVLACEAEPGRRIYLCAFNGGDGGRSWVALEADGAPVEQREALRDAVSISALCELAVETAGGGDLPELRSQLMAIRLRERPPGIEDAEDAALELERTVDLTPRLASPAYLDAIGGAATRLEQALGQDRGSPFADAMRQATGAVDALMADVEAGYKAELRS